ncbi:MAG: amidohydrolase [Magnetococcales bacterium]|nr:amidohydrolase [Magnetococcales bacterium]MBF0150095.1 amidohydrolase [Magnetococcales bacterium]
MTLTIANAVLEGYADLISIRIRDGRIEAIGPGLEGPEHAPRLDAAGMTVIPGLVNAHTHAAMTLLRGAGDDLPLMTWLNERIWPAEARLSEEDVYWGTRLACVEMIRSGTVAFQDGYWHVHGMARAVRESGLRVALGLAMVDAQGGEQGDACKKAAREFMAQRDPHEDRIQPILFPHAIYSVSPENLRWCARFADDHGLNVHIHLSETPWEVNDCLNRHGMRPAFYLDTLGLLHQRSILAHGVFLDDDELDLIALRGATLVTNPTSNLKLAVGGIFPHERAAARGIPVGLGSDGAASNNSLDLFAEMKTFALIQKHARGDPTAMPAPLALDIAMGRKAPILGQTGIIAPGHPADLLLIRTHECGMVPPLNLASNLVYAATGAVVDTTIVAGRVLMHHRFVEGEGEIRREVTARALALTRLHPS